MTPERWQEIRKEFQAYLAEGMPESTYRQWLLERKNHQTVDYSQPIYEHHESLSEARYRSLALTPNERAERDREICAAKARGKTCKQLAYIYQLDASRISQIVRKGAANER